MQSFGGVFGALAGSGVSARLYVYGDGEDFQLGGGLQREWAAAARGDDVGNARAAAREQSRSARRTGPCKSCEPQPSGRQPASACGAP
mmetsp:Transcript_87237/g.271338  ORF Transcript_87237/g.271338 Transcript_87237/m.271338 type:complete len:88 (+) Transcript_87237:48-311(+)